MRFSFLVGSFWVLLSVLTIGCSRVHHLASSEHQNYQIATPVDTPLQSSNPIEGIVAPYRDELATEMNEVVGQSVKELTKSRGECTMGNWVADAILGFTEDHLNEDLDFAICNTGGLRMPALPKGPITRGTIFELMPFDNYLVLMRLDGETVKRLFDHMAARDGWPISHGVNYVIEGDKAIDILIEGKPLDPRSVYTVVLSDYIAEGGDSSDFLESKPSEKLDVYYRDAMIGYALMLTAKGEKIDAEIEGRIKAD